MIATALALLSLATVPAFGAPAPATLPAANATMTTLADKNLKMAVQSCSSRMDGKLPPFVPTAYDYSGNVRQYFVKAEEIEWDYIPSGWDNMRGVPIEDSPVSSGADYTTSSNSIGSKYIKGLFRGYTDSNFTSLTEQPDWLGIQGPIMRGEVGDLIEVMVYNDLRVATHPVSMHSMGLHYSPISEGSMYYRGKEENGTAISYGGDAIQPGECFVYKWLIPAGSAPDPGLPSKLWSYHSDLNLNNDVMSGFFGPFIAYNKGQMASTMAKYKKEYIMYFGNIVEAQSYYLNDNVARFLPDLKFDADTGAPADLPSATQNETVWGNIYNDLPPVGGNETLAQAFTSINGFAYANMPTLEICQDEEVIWHIWSMGSFNDGFHSAHWHGNNVQLGSGANMAQISLLPASMITVLMNAGNVGLWQFLCHVGAHWQSGMQVNYMINPTGTTPSCPAKPDSSSAPLSVGAAAVAGL